MMIDFAPDSASDDPAFIRLVASVAQSVAKAFRPTEICVVKIDNWFDAKWLAFSGKTIGAVGVWQCDMTVPPFVSNRVVSQVRHQLASDRYKAAGAGAPLHRKQPASANL